MSNMVVQTNVLALNTHRNMKNIGQITKKASSRLSSGYRINNAADDAAGLAISEKMRSQIRGLDMASKNSQDAQALVNTAEGGMQEITNMVQRVRELAVQSATGTNTDSDRVLIDLEAQQLISEIDARSSQVQYNKMTLLDGTFTVGSSTGTAAAGAAGGAAGALGSAASASLSAGAPANPKGALTFQVGPNQGHTMTLTIGAMNAVGLGLATSSGTGSARSIATTISLATQSAASAALSKLDSAVTKAVTARAKLGAVSNRLDYTVKALDVTSENLSDAESRIRDADMAKEMMSYTKANVLQQAAVSMLSQANAQPQNLLSLLR